MFERQGVGRGVTDRPARLIARSPGSGGAPALRPVPDPVASPFRSTLPPATVALVGRQPDLERALRAVIAGDPYRLVTVTGPGGVGKTRLASDVARRAAGRFNGAVLFVPVAFVTDADTALGAIATAAGWEVVDQAGVRDVVRRGLSAQPTLLVLDNCEQIPDLGPVLGELLTACPELVILATSRRALQLGVERVVAIEPLPVPRPGARVREVAENESVTVLVNAARRRNPAYEVTRENAAALADICVRLDGLPLALELAAARLHLVSPGEMLTLLENRFDVLHVATTDVVPHHRRLWATIDWSYQLLDATDQRRFRALGVFPNGFTLDAAAAVAGADTIEMLDVLSGLVDHHLVRAITPRGGNGRFELLESIREFALSELADRGELAGVSAAHADWCTSIAHRWGPALTSGAEQDHAVALLDAERENLRVALTFLIDDGRREQAQRLATDLWRYWWARGAVVEGLGWLRSALDGETAATPVTAAAYQAAGDLAEISGDLAGAAGFLAQAIEVREQLGDEAALAGVWNSLAFVERELGHLDRAAELHASALEVFRRIGNPRPEAVALNGLGAVASRRGDHASAAARWSEALAIVERLGDRRASVLVVGNVGAARLALGDVDGALACHRQALAAADELGDVGGLVNSLTNVAEAEVAAGALDAAVASLDRAERIASETGNLLGAAVIAHHRGLVAERRGLLGESFGRHLEGLRQVLAVGHPIEAIESLERLGMLAAELDDHALAWRCLSAAAAARTANGTVALPGVEHWVRTLRDRSPGEQGPAPPAPWPAAAEQLLPDLAAFATAHAAARRRSTSAAPADDPLRQLGLTAREAEVARLVVARRTDVEIAAELYIGVRTVATHVSAVLRKLGVSSRRAVAARLAELGFDVAPGG
jgi:predicted ATPase/DNA-binding CsgD family transcriptional regulator